MNIDDSRGAPNYNGRKPNAPKYQEKGYSPSMNYNYNQGSNFNGQSQQHQHPRRRTDRFKRETINMSDRIVKQNDIIIRLLKEIRDRLPAPATAILSSTESPDQAFAGSGEQVPNHDVDECESCEAELTEDARGNRAEPD